jgi:hypothetical protein
MKFALKESMVERATDAPSKAASGARSPNCGPLCARVAAIGCSPPSSRPDVRQFGLPRRQNGIRRVAGCATSIGCSPPVNIEPRYNIAPGCPQPHLAVNRLVAGSNPTRGANQINELSGNFHFKNSPKLAWGNIWGNNLQNSPPRPSRGRRCGRLVA